MGMQRRFRPHRWSAEEDFKHPLLSWGRGFKILLVAGSDG